MSGLPAARITDSVAHRASGNIIEGSPNVRIGRQCLPAARVGDKVQHGHGVCVITEGEPTVRINGQWAARVTDDVSCEGSIASGCDSVRIGKPRGKVIGDVTAGQKMCRAAANGRTWGSLQQSYSNCAVESARQIINQAKNKNISEDELLRFALSRGYADRGSVVIRRNAPPGSGDGGAALSTKIVPLLRSYGVPATVQNSNWDNMARALVSGKGVIAETDASVLWRGVPEFQSLPPTGSPHAVVVTGIEYDDGGNVINIIINDSAGQCSRKVPVDQWNEGVRSLSNMTNKSTEKKYDPPGIVITNVPIF